MLYNPEFKAGLLDSPEPGVFFVESFWEVLENFSACEFRDSIDIPRSYAFRTHREKFRLDMLREHGMLEFLAEDFPGKAFVTIYEYDEKFSEVCIWQLRD